MKENEEIKKLFKLYLEGRTNPLQDDILFSYLSDTKNKDSEFHDLMSQAWQNEPSERDRSPEAAESLNQIRARLDHKKQPKVHHYQFLKYAASFVLVLSAIVGWYSYKKYHAAEVNTIELLSKSTGKGEKIKMILPDSSVVYLAGNSKLTWPSKFIKGNHRNISLEGEAFFEVKRDTTSPFIIKTGNMQTQVLGTSFNIYAYPKDQTFSVAVRTGKVKVSENKQGKVSTLSVLTLGMKLVYHRDNGKYELNTERVNEINAWTENRFVFRNESLMEMLDQLERYYNVHFELRSRKLSDCRFNATFYNKSIKDVMEQLSIMTGNHMKYKISSDHKLITLWGEGCQW